MRRKHLLTLGLIVVFTGLILSQKRVELKGLPKSSAATVNMYKNPPLLKKRTDTNSPKVGSFLKKEIRRVDKAKDKNDPDLERLYCKIKTLAPNITLSGEIKIVAGGYNPDDPGEYAWIHSSECPNDKYSIVKINSSNKIEMGLHCHDATMEDLVGNSGLQWSITYHGIKENEFNFALNGKGQFLMYCPMEKSFFLTRNGHFFPDNSGFLQNSLGCLLQKAGSLSNPQHKPLVVDSFENRFDDRGCIEGTNECIAVVQYNDTSVLDFEYINSELSRVEIDSFHLNSGPYQIFSDYLENLDDPDRGPTGIQTWNKIKSLEMPIECPE